VTGRRKRDPARSRGDRSVTGKAMQLVLSIFPGIDLLGRGFEAEGFCVVRAAILISTCVVWLVFRRSKRKRSAMLTREAIVNGCSLCHSGHFVKGNFCRRCGRRSPDSRTAADVTSEIAPSPLGQAQRFEIVLSDKVVCEVEGFIERISTFPEGDRIQRKTRIRAFCHPSSMFHF